MRLGQRVDAVGLEHQLRVGTVGDALEQKRHQRRAFAFGHVAEHGCELVGMQIPPNFGRRYADEFAAVFGNAAKSEGAALVPFLLKGVADGPDPQLMFQADRIHPLAEAHPAMLDNVWAGLKPLLK